MFDYKKYPKKTLIARVEAPAFRGATVATPVGELPTPPVAQKDHCFTKEALEPKPYSTNMSYME